MAHPTNFTLGEVATYFDQALRAIEAGLEAVKPNGQPDYALQLAAADEMRLLLLALMANPRQEKVSDPQDSSEEASDLPPRSQRKKTAAPKLAE